jgi:uncharacterized protein (TIRG00374 family)
MKRKHAITTAIVVLILGILVYAQFRTWRRFDWHQFFEQTGRVSIWMILGGVLLIYSVYVLRAIRWAIFLAPAKKTEFTRMIPSQFIGFTGLALLGRPGEFVRPYLVAKKEDLTFSSQLAVWAVERVFDMCSVALLLGATLAFKGGKYKQFPQVEQAGIAMLVLATALALFVIALWWRSEAISNFIERILRMFSEKIAGAVCRRVRAFGEGLHTIHSWRSFVAVALLSIGIWLIIARAYIQVMHAYPQTTSIRYVDEDNDPSTPAIPVTKTVRLHEMKLEDVLLVMGASMIGSVVQLPGVGGGSQLAVIGLLSSDIFKGEPYNITRELAVSCGIMLWLVTFMSVIPAGLFLAHRERISLKAVSEESEAEAEG